MGINFYLINSIFWLLKIYFYKFDKNYFLKSNNLHYYYFSLHKKCSNSIFSMITSRHSCSYSCVCLSSFIYFSNSWDLSNNWNNNNNYVWNNSNNRNRYKKNYCFIYFKSIRNYNNNSWIRKSYTIIFSFNFSCVF